MNNIYVAVAHDLCRFDASQVEFDPKLRKHFVVDPASKPVQVVPKGTMLSAKKTEVEGPVVAGFPTSQVSWVGVDEIPAEALGADALVVSAIYASAWRATHPHQDPPVPFYGVLNPVCMRSEDNTTKVVGCLGLQPL